RLGTAATSIVGGSSRAADTAEDPDYIKVRDYLVALESHLSEAHRQASRLAAKEVELGEATLEFGQALERLGRLEEGNVSEAFSQMSARSAELVAARRKGCEALAARFEAPLKESVRSVRAVTAVCNDRALALATHMAAKHDVDAKKVRWAKLRGTPGSPQEKLTEAEREVTEAEERLRSSKISYEELVATMTEELNRWQKERAADMAALLRDFALAQASMASEGVRAWSGLLAELQAVSGAASRQQHPQPLLQSCDNLQSGCGCSCFRLLPCLRALLCWQHST
ncbi:Vps5 C terminal like-domain-containing protein, partial [Scenedesmus sp. NREL 46B-D3]